MPTNKKMKVAVLGAGNMGTAIAQVIASNGFVVNLWNHAGDLLPLEQIAKFGENKAYLKGVKLSGNIIAQPDMKLAVRGVGMIFLVVPSFCVESVVKQMSSFLDARVICVDVSKGLVEKPVRLVSDIIYGCLPSNSRELFATISGPAIAIDMAQGNFTAMDVASKSEVSISAVKNVLENDNLKLVSCTDVIGVDLAGSFKNVYAILFGMTEGFGLEMNTKAALLVYALREMNDLIVKMGGQNGTAYGLAGIGDLIGTGFCAKSRNHRFGMYLAQGFSVDKSLKKVGQVVEGKTAVKIFCDLAKKFKVKAPLAGMINRCVAGGDVQILLRQCFKQLC